MLFPVPFQSQVPAIPTNCFIVSLIIYPRCYRKVKFFGRHPLRPRKTAVGNKKVSVQAISSPFAKSSRETSESELDSLGLAWNGR